MQSSGVGGPPGGPPPPAGPPGGPAGIGRASTVDDGDNRSRNAKAQRRHREKRKAHFKALEEQVQVLAAQLEDARRQVAAAQYASNARLTYPPDDKGAVQTLASENAYLRDENAELRRQLYSMRVSYGGREPGSAGPLPAPSSTDQPKTTTGIWPEVKTETAPYGGVYGAQPGGGAVVSYPPRVPGFSHARTQSHPGEFVRDPNAEPSSATSAYPPHLYQFGSVAGDDKWSGEPTRQHPPRGGSSSSSRGRLGSVTTASPYAASAPFPTDPRAHALSGGTPTQPYLVRYDSAVYPPAAPPPHNLPRSAMGSGGSGSYAHATTPVQTYVPRAEGEVAWSGQDPQPTDPRSSTAVADDCTLRPGTGVSQGRAAATSVTPSTPIEATPHRIPNHKNIEQEPRQDDAEQQPFPALFSPVSVLDPHSVTGVPTLFLPTHLVHPHSPPHIVPAVFIPSGHQSSSSCYS